MRISIFLFGLLLVSCGQKSQNQLGVGERTGIIGGNLVEEKTEIASVTVGIYDSELDSICSGTLLSDNAVLTAAHCVYKVNPDRLRIVFSTRVMPLLATSEQDVREEYMRPVTHIRVHQKYNPDLHDEMPFDWADLAVIKFKGGLAEGYQPVTMLKDAKLIKPQALLTMAGYGVDSVTTRPINPKKVKNLREAIAYGEVVCDDNLEFCEEVLMSGDGDLRATQAPIAYVVRSELRLDETQGHATCAGDSGGPAFMKEDGQLRLVGLTSRGSELCDGVGIYTNAIYYKDWIEDIVESFAK